mgnify:CR=1 FL=1
MPGKVTYTKRKDGRYQAKMYCGTENGVPKYKYVYATTEREMKAKLSEKTKLVNRGIDITSERETFGDWLEMYLITKQSSVSDKWYRAIRTNAKILEPLKDTKLSVIKQYMLTEILFDMANKGYSEKTMQSVKGIAQGVLELAADNRAIDHNFFKNVAIPKAKQEPEHRRALTSEEQAWIRDTPHRAQTAAMIMMYAGLRRGELLALTWQDIDLDAHAIKVERSVSMIKGKPHIKEGGKTDAATRTVYIPGKLVNYLRSTVHNPIGLVCPTVKGSLMTETGFSRMWESYLNDLNIKYGNWADCMQTSGKCPSKYAPIEKPFLIPRITPHWLRHTFITLMYLAGVDVLTAKEQAGHADIKTTMAIYTHLDEKYKKKSINKLDEYLESIS